MSERNPVAVLDIRLVEDKSIDETFFQDYQKVHEKLERVLEKIPKPLDDPSFGLVEEQLLAWLHVQEARKDAGDRLTSLLRCGLGHLCVARRAGTQPGLPIDEIVALAMGDLKTRGWAARIFDPEAAAIAAKKFAVSEKKSTSARPASRKNDTAAGKTGARQRSEKEVSAMDDSNQVSGVAGASPTDAAAKAADAKPKAAKKPVAKKPAVKKAVEKKPAVKKVAEKKPAAKKVVAKKPAAKKVAVKKPVAKKPAVKKVAEKKTVAKKPAVKKVAAKKPAVKKVAAKKPVAKKPVAKKAVAAKKPAVKKAAVAKKPAVKKAAAPKKVAKK